MWKVVFPTDYAFTLCFLSHRFHGNAGFTNLMQVTTAPSDRNRCNFGVFT